MAELLARLPEPRSEKPAQVPAAPRPEPAAALLEARDLSVRYGRRLLLRRLDLVVPARRVLAVVGPSGVGKSTLLRCFNRLLDLTPELEVEGDVLLAGRSIFAPEVDPDELRARIGMLFQQPAVFPRSIRENVLFGARRLRRLSRRKAGNLAERMLREVGLWDEVKDRLGEPGPSLSVGQQQRLCLARALAVGPEVLLMDEPTSALDERSAAAVERLILGLRDHHTVVLVTHDLAQAARLADLVARLELEAGAGELAELRTNERLEHADP